MTNCSLTLIVVALAGTGCASGQPLAAVVPDEHHLRAATSGVPGDYRDAEPTGIGQLDLTWAPVEVDDDERQLVILHQVRVVSPQGLQAAPDYEVTAEVKPDAGAGRLSAVSAALFILDPTPRLEPERRIDAILANLDRVPPAFAAKLREAPYAVADLQPDAQGSFRHTFRVPEGDLRFGAAWFGRAADLLVSIVLRDEAGRLRRVVLGAGVSVAEDSSEPAAPR